jgi:secretion/DNA translocation related CpaE-like protein
MQPVRTVVGVLGASGGVGASTLSVALGARLARQGLRAVVVDSHFARGGLDVTACLEHLPGLRWADLADAEGPLDAPRLVDALPRHGDLVVLSAGPGSPAPRPPVVDSTLDALGSFSDAVVLDLPASVHELPAWLRWCTAVVVLTGLGPRALADADAACGVAAKAVSSTWLAVRAQPRQRPLVDRVVAHLDLPLAALIPTLPELAAEADRGLVPGERDRHQLSEVADHVVERVLGADPREAADRGGTRRLRAS